MLSCRALWMRILAVRLFMDYMNPLRGGPEMTRKALKSVSVSLLWKVRNCALSSFYGATTLTVMKSYASV